MAMKVVVITGGSDGLGKALAVDFCGRYQVVVLSRNEETLKQVATEASCDYRVCDVADHQQVEQVMREIAAQYGRIDVLINNAGVFLESELADASYEDIHRIISVNTIGALYVAKAALMQMKQQGGGLLINVISQSGINTRPYRSVYNTSKWALTGLTKALQQEVAGYGVRVTGFYPGLLDTNFLQKAGAEPNGASMEVKEAVGAINYILSAGDETLIPELGIKHYMRLV